MNKFIRGGWIENSGVGEAWTATFGAVYALNHDFEEAVLVADNAASKLNAAIRAEHDRIVAESRERRRW